jgi:hypothetical protein
MYFAHQPKSMRSEVMSRRCVLDHIFSAHSASAKLAGRSFASAKHGAEPGDRGIDLGSPILD